MLVVPWVWNPLGFRAFTLMVQPPHSSLAQLSHSQMGHERRWQWWSCKLLLMTQGSTSAVSGYKLPPSDVQGEGARGHAFAERGFGTSSWLKWFLLPFLKPCKKSLCFFSSKDMKTFYLFIYFTKKKKKEGCEYVMQSLLGKQSKQWETSQSP